MRFLFLGIFFLSVISGALAWYANVPQQSRQDIIHDFLSNIRAKQSLGRYHGAEVNVLSRERARKMAQAYDDMLRNDDVWLAQTGNQRDMVEKVMLQEGLMKDMMNNFKQIPGMDLIRLKTIADAMEDQHRLLTEQGRRLTEVNEKLVQAREKIKRENNLNNDDIAIRGESLKSHIGEIISRQDDFIDQSQKRIDILREKSNAINDDLNLLHAPPLMTSDEQQKMINIKEMASNQRGIFREMMQKQEDIREVRKNNEDLKKLVYEKVKDTIEHNKNLQEASMQKLDDQKSVIDQRTRDLLGSIKEKSMH